MHDLVAYKAATSEEQEAIPLPRILIIDDSPAICDLLCQVLEHACYRVAAVPGGGRARLPDAGVTWWASFSRC